MSRTLVTSVLVGAALFVAPQARAVGYNLNGWNYGNGENVEILTSPDLQNTWVYAGQIILNLTPAAGGNSFTLPTWCTDVYNWQQSTGLYTMQAPLVWNGHDSVSLDTAQVAQMGWLMNNFATATPSSDLEAATQLAIWQIEYGAATFTFAASPAVTTLVGTLEGLADPNFQGGVVAGLIPNPPGTNQTQSFLFSTTGGGHDITDSPEPASMTLLGAGLAGLAAVRRRKAAKRG